MVDIKRCNRAILSREAGLYQGIYGVSVETRRACLVGAGERNVGGRGEEDKP